MKRCILLFLVLSLLSCGGKRQETIDTGFVVIPIGGKLSKLLSMPRDTILDYYDLSNDFLMEQPDLSRYTIKSLDLSNNYLDSLVLHYLPKGLEVLNISYNYLRQMPLETNIISELKALNLSHNYIKYYRSAFFVHRLDISYNCLYRMELYKSNWYWYYYSRSLSKDHKRMSYLNISNNPRLNNRVWFVPGWIDTIIHHGIANDNPIEMIDNRLHGTKPLQEIIR